MTEETGFLKELTQINFVEIMLLLLAAWVSFKVVKQGIPWLVERSPSRFRLHLLPLMPILQLIIIVTAVFAIVPLVIDPSPENLLAASGVVAISLGFAFQDYASSLIAGIVTIYERPYRIGDWIKIDDAYGEVTAVQFRTVQIVTPDDTVVLIPHKKLWDSLIYNDNNGSREHLCVADFYLHPEHDAEAVCQELRKVALTSPYLQINRPITVVVHEKPWGTHYRLKAYPIDGRNQFKFTSDMTTRGKKVLAELGAKSVVIPHTSGVGG